MRRENAYIIVLATCFILLIGVVAYIYKSDKFEREAPKINLNGPVYWNFKTPLNIKISDNVEIKYCKIKIEEPTREMVIFDSKFDKSLKVADLNLTYPKNGFVPTSDKAMISVVVQDSSLWNFFSGNKTEFRTHIIPDNTPPKLDILANSYSISKGGSALIIFEANDENLEQVYIKNNNKIFNAQQFLKHGYYASLIAWDIKSEMFNAEVVAIDKAKNISKTPIKIATKNIIYKDTKIELKDDFLDGKILELAANMPNIQSASKIDRFLFVNAKMRSENEALVEKVTNRVGKDMISSYFSEPFLPIVNASVVGTYGDHRNFFYGGSQVSDSYHMGIDFASTKEANIFAPNDGVVIYTGYNGIYGNLLVLYHNLGLFTVYGHCSSFVAKDGQKVSRGDIIAKTGSTGLALGDHLHYGIIVQGIDVRPAEWLDKNWINLNVIKIMDDAAKVIKSRP